MKRRLGKVHVISPVDAKFDNSFLVWVVAVVLCVVRRAGMHYEELKRGSPF